MVKFFSSGSAFYCCFGAANCDRCFSGFLAGGHLVKRVLTLDQSISQTPEASFKRRYPN